MKTITVRKYLQETVLQRMVLGRSVKTQQGDRTAAKFVCSKIGDKQLQDLRYDDLCNVMYQRLHSIPGREASASTMSKTRAVLLKLSKEAAFEDYIPDKLLLRAQSDIHPGGVKKTTKDTEYKVLAPATVQNMLQCAKNDKDKFWQTALLVFLNTGMRPQELCGLKIEDIDYEAGMIHIRRAAKLVEVESSPDVFSMGKTKTDLGDTKSKAGVRDLPLDGKTLEALQDWITYMSSKPNQYGLIFPSRSGGIISHSQLPHRFAHFREKHQLDKRITLYCFRHTFCTRLMLQGVPQVMVQKLMGHKDLKMIMEVYTHIPDGITATAKPDIGAMMNGMLNETSKEVLSNDERD